jgi:ADP-ribose pyrophosphatase YjhB (NUDIX family)
MLLVRRSDNGRWAVPGGYMEPGGAFTEACAREVLEETGLHVRVGKLVGEETVDVGYFPHEEMAEMEMSGLDRQRIADGFAAQTEAFVRDSFKLL